MSHHFSDLSSSLNNARLSPTISARIQHQFQSIVIALNDIIGQEATKAYLKCLCSDAHLDLVLAESVRSNNSGEKECKASECRPCTRPPFEDMQLGEESEDIDSPSRQLQEAILASIQMREGSVSERGPQASNDTTCVRSRLQSASSEAPFLSTEDDGLHNYIPALGQDIEMQDCSPPFPTTSGNKSGEGVTHPPILNSLDVC